MPRRIGSVREEQKEADRWALGFLNYKKSRPYGRL